MIGQVLKYFKGDSDFFLSGKAHNCKHVTARVELSFETNFNLAYQYGRHKKKLITCYGKEYEISNYLPLHKKKLSIKVFIKNPDLLKDQTIRLMIIEDNVVVKQIAFFISSTQKYDGWFVLVHQEFDGNNLD
jgi:hypothetical protein